MTNFLPKPISTALSAYRTEPSPFAKLHRLLDTFEALVKYLAVIAVTDFYSTDLPDEFEAVDKWIRENLPRLSLGNWVRMLRTTLAAFAGYQELLFAPKLYDFYFVTAKGKPKTQKHMTDQGALGQLLRLRNLLAHGATIAAPEAAAHVALYAPYLDELLDKSGFLTELPLILVHQAGLEDRCLVQKLMGSEFASQAPQMLKLLLPASTQGHLVICNPQTQARLDLYPLLVYDECHARVPILVEDRQKGTDAHLCGESKAFYFNDHKKRNRIAFLDYSRGHHQIYESPTPLIDSYQSQFGRRELTTTPHFSDQAFINNVTELFVGREPELAAIDEFVQNSSKQVLFVVGSPGIGKTALLARWCDTHTSVRHFIREGDTPTIEAVSVLGEMTQQLVRLYGVQGTKLIGPEPRAARAAFSATMVEAAKEAQGPLVVVIDGLDEAIRANPANPEPDASGLLAWLPRPDQFPKSIKWIVSARPGIEREPALMTILGRETAQRLHLEGLTADDTRALLWQVHSKYEVLANPEFVSAVVQRAQGNPLYVRLFTEDLLEGHISFGKVDQLPHSLADYFHRTLQHIEQLTGPSENTSIRLEARRAALRDLVNQGLLSEDQLAGQLALRQDSADGVTAGDGVGLLSLYCLVKQPVSLGQAAQILGWSSYRAEQAYHKIDSVLLQHDRHTLTVFHASFRRFFLDLDQHSASRVHRHKAVIASVENQILAYCGKWSEHLNDYVLSHYAEHLCDADKWQELHALLTGGAFHNEWAEAKNRRDGGYHTYLRDLDLLWEWAIERKAIAVELECALIAASIHELARLMPPAVLLRLHTMGTPEGRWDIDGVIDYIGTMTQCEQQAEALALFAREVEARPQDWLRMLQIATHIQTGMHRSCALAALAPRLTEAQASTALESCHSMQAAEDRLSALVALLPRLPLQDRWRASKTLVKCLSSMDFLNRWIDDALAECASAFDESVVREAMGVACSASTFEFHCALAKQLNRTELALELQAARADEQPQRRAWRLASLALIVPSLLREATLGEAISASESVLQDSSRAELLILMAPGLLETRHLRDLDLALNQTLELPDRVTRLLRLLPWLPPAQRPRALDYLSNVPAGGLAEQVFALGGIVPYLADPQNLDALDRAVMAVEGEREHLQPILLEFLATVAPEDRRTQLLHRSDAVGMECGYSLISPYRLPPRTPQELGWVMVAVMRYYSPVRGSTVSSTRGYSGAAIPLRILDELLLQDGPDQSRQQSPLIQSNIDAAQGSGPDLLADFVQQIGAIGDSTQREAARAALLPYLPVTKAIEELDRRLELLEATAALELLAWVPASGDLTIRKHAADRLTRLVQQLCNQNLNPDTLAALVACLSAVPETHRTDVSGAIVGFLHACEPTSNVDELVLMLITMGVDELVLKLTPFSVPAQQLPAVLDLVMAVTDEKQKLQALAGLSEQLPSQEVMRVLATARDLAKGDMWVDLLSLLAEKHVELVWQEVLSYQSRPRLRHHRQTIVGKMLDSLTLKQIRELVLRIDEFVESDNPTDVDRDFIMSLIDGVLQHRQIHAPNVFCEISERLWTVSSSLFEAIGQNHERPRTSEDSDECYVSLEKLQTAVQNEIGRQRMSFMKNKLIPEFGMALDETDPIERAAQLTKWAKLFLLIFEGIESSGRDYVDEALKAWLAIDCGMIAGPDEDEKIMACCERRTAILRELAPCLVTDHLARLALAGATHIDHICEPGETLAVLSPSLPETVAVEALRSLRGPRAVDPLSSEYQLMTLTGLATTLPDGSLLEGLLLALEYDSGELRRETTEPLMARLQRLDKARILEWWHTSTIQGVAISRFLARFGRRCLMEDVAELAPLVAAISGSAVVEQVYDAIERIGRWWP